MGRPPPCNDPWCVLALHLSSSHMPTVPYFSGIRRRGMTPGALQAFMLSQGPSHAQTTLEWDSIWTINKKMIDSIVPRHTAVLKEGAFVYFLQWCFSPCSCSDAHFSVKMQIRGAPLEPQVKQIPKHKKNAELGFKSTSYMSQVLIEGADAQSFGPDEEVRPPFLVGLH